MKKVLEHIIFSLVDKKDKVVINEEVSNKFIRYNISVDKDDFGKIIGHEGKIAKSIRSIMGAVATVNDVKIVVNIR